MMFCSRSAVAASTLTSFVCFCWVGCGDEDPPPDDVVDVGPAHATARVAKRVRAAIRPAGSCQPLQKCLAAAVVVGRGRGRAGPPK